MKKITVIFILVLLVPLFAIDHMWNSWLRTQDSEKQIWILNKTNEKYDLAILGNSRAFTSFDIDSLNAKLTYKSINLGCDGASMMESYVILSQFLKNGNKLRSLYVQLDNSSLIEMNEAYSYPFHDYLFLNRLGDDDVRNALIRSRGYLRYYFWRYIPAVKYSEFNNFYSLKALVLDGSGKSKTNYDLTGGSRLDDLQITETISKEKNNSCFFTANETSLLYVDQIIELCKKHNIKYGFFKVPVYSEAYHCTHEKADRFIIQLSQKYHCRYLNFQDVPWAVNRFYFKDQSHLNIHGARRFTSFFADSLSRTF